MLCKIRGDAIYNMKRRHEIFNVNHWISFQNTEISGQAVVSHDKIFDCEVLSLWNTGKIQVPKTIRQGFFTEVPVISFDIFIYSGRQFTVEFVLYDNYNTKRKLMFVPCREIVPTTLYARVPHSNFVKDRWNLLRINVESFVKEC